MAEKNKIFMVLYLLLLAVGSKVSPGFHLELRCGEIALDGQTDLTLMGNENCKADNNNSHHG